MALIKCPDCETDVSDQAVACPKCARPIKKVPKARKSSPKVEDKVDEVEGDEDTRDAFPNFRRHPVPCPSCDKKSLRPRMRTHDFRCQACSATFPGDEIEDRIARDQARVARSSRREQVVKRLTEIIDTLQIRCVPEDCRIQAYDLRARFRERHGKFTSMAPSRLPALEPILPGAWVATAVVTGCFVYGWLGGWGVWPRALVSTLSGGIIGLILTSAFAVSDIFPTETLKVDRARLQAQETWELAHPHLAMLLRHVRTEEAAAAAIAQYGTDEEKAAYASAVEERQALDAEERG